MINQIKEFGDLPNGPIPSRKSCNAMKSMRCTTTLMRRLPSHVLPPCKNVKGKTKTVTCYTYIYSISLRCRSLSYHQCKTSNKWRLSTSCIMTSGSKRGLFHHTPSMGFIGHGFTPGKLSSGFLEQVNEEEHSSVPNFAESFTTSSSGKS